jgi:hypothetical protein
MRILNHSFGHAKVNKRSTQGATGGDMRLNANGRFNPSGSDRGKLSLQQQMEQIVASGHITRREHLDLTSALLADQSLTDGDRFSINRILESVRLGKLELRD